MTFSQEEYMFISMWKTLHLQLWAKFHSGQLLMRLVVGLTPVRLGQTVTEFKNDCNPYADALIPSLDISLPLTVSASLSAEPPTISCLKLNWFAAQRSYFFLSSPTVFLPLPCPPLLILSIIYCNRTRFSPQAVLKTWTFYLCEHYSWSVLIGLS